MFLEEKDKEIYMYRPFRGEMIEEKGRGVKKIITRTKKPTPMLNEY